MLDIHSHILPGVDDGAKDINTSVQLLSSMKAQGITDVISTTHFNPMAQDIADFKKNVKNAYEKLTAEISGTDLPRIGTGSEILYFKGIGKTQGLYDLTLCNSNYVLIEFAGEEITDYMIEDIKKVRSNLGLIPIMAHIERYSHMKGYRKFLKMIASGDAFAQINASSFFDGYRRIVLKLIKKGYISFIATDAHSMEKRPPKMADALLEIENKFGKEQKNFFIINSQQLCAEIFNSNGDINGK